MSADTGDDGSAPTASGLAAGGEHRLYRLLTEGMKDVVWVLDVETLRFLYVSPSVQALRGYTPAEIMAEPMDAALTPEAAAYVRSLMDRDVQEILDGRRSIDEFYTEEVEQPCKDGSTVMTEVISRYHRNEQTGAFEVWGVTRDITDRRSVEEKLLLLAENVTDVVLRLDDQHRVEWVSPSVEGVLGWQPDELTGRSITELVHSDDLPGAWESVSGAIHDGEDFIRIEARYAMAGGGWRWMSAAIRILRDKDQALVGMVDALRDIQEEVDAREALERSERRFRLAMAEAPQGMAILGLDGRFEEVNPALCRILGFPEERLLGRAMADSVHPEERSEWAVPVRELLADRAEHVTRETRFIRGDGREIWVQHALGLVRDTDGAPVSFVSQVQDITESKLATQQLAHQATHDRLTGLLNREEFFHRLDSTLNHPPRTGHRVGVLFCDVDNLKGVNDTLGHAAGDLLLVAVSRAIRDAVRATDFVGRLGGDEFVVVLTGLHSEGDALRIAEALRAAVGEPVDYEGNVIVPAISVGLAMADGSTATPELLRRADVAVYAAKAAGRDRVIAYRPDLGP